MSNDLNIKIPLVKGIPLIGNFFQINKKNILEFIHRSRRQYGDVFEIKILHKRVLVICSTDYFKHIFNNNSDNYIKGELYIALRPIAPGFFSERTEKYKKRRKMLMPSFTRDAVATSLPLMIQALNDVKMEWINSSEKNDVRCVSTDMQNLSLRIISQVAFGHDIHEYEGIIGQAMSDLNASVLSKMLNFIKWPYWLPTPLNRKIKASSNTLKDVCLKIIKSKKDTLSADWLGIMLNTKDEKGHACLTNEDITEEVQTLMIVGHETTAKALAVMWHYLAADNDVLKKIREELKNNVKHSSSPTFEELNNLSYCKKVINEVLRIHPSIWGISRMSINSDQINNIQIAKKTRILIPIYELHHHEKYWSEPELFNPERFDFPNISSIDAFIPFGLGARFCVGSQFAILEMLLVLCVFGPLFDITLKSNPQLEVYPQLSLGTKENIKIQLSKVSIN